MRCEPLSTRGEVAGPAYTPGHGISLHGQAREVVGRSPLVPRKDAWDLAPLAASSRGGFASCGGMRREPDVRQVLVERAGTLMREVAAMEGVRIKTLIDIDSRRFDKAVAEVKERQGTAPGIVFGDFRGMLDDKEIDTLVVGTPDRWHAIPTILGCQAGKHLCREARRAQPSPLTPILRVGVGHIHTPILRFEKLDRLRSGK